MFKAVRHDRKFFFDKETANSRLYKAVFDDSGGRRVRTVRRTESVVDVNVRVFGKSLAEVFVPAFFAGVETQVFKKYAFAVLQRRDFFFRVRADDVGCKRYLVVKKFVQARRNGSKTEFFDVFFRLFDCFGGCRSAFFFG